MINWKKLHESSYADILYNVSEVIFNMYYSNYSRTLFEDMQQFMIYKMVNVISTTGVDTMRSLRNYLMMISRNGGSMYLYHDNKTSNLVELTDLNAPSVDFVCVDELSSKDVYSITSRYLDLGDYTTLIMNTLKDYGVTFDSWYSDNIVSEPLTDVDMDIFYMLRGMVVWKLAKAGDLS